MMMVMMMRRRRMTMTMMCRAIYGYEYFSFWEMMNGFDYEVWFMVTDDDYMGWYYGWTGCVLGCGVSVFTQIIPNSYIYTHIYIYTVYIYIQHSRFKLTAGYHLTLPSSKENWTWIPPHSFSFQSLQLTFSKLFQTSCPPEKSGVGGRWLSWLKQLRFCSWVGRRRWRTWRTRCRESHFGFDELWFMEFMGVLTSKIMEHDDDWCGEKCEMIPEFDEHLLKKLGRCLKRVN